MSSPAEPHRVQRAPFSLLNPGVNPHTDPPRDRDAESLLQDARPAIGNTLRDLLIHLRLHFQLLLAPIFLWGFFLAGGVLTADFWLAFLAFHLFLYGGTTAYNSYYDRDEGPVGGLEQPPPVSPWLLPFALIMQAVGALLAALVNLPVLIVYLAIFLMATAYSHPRLRLKGRPVIGLLTVALGQGVLAALGGWLTAQPSLASVDAQGWIGIVAVTLITTGFYPITQIYQVDEDLARGDLTFAAWAGPQRTFAFAITLQAVAVPLLLWTLWQTVGPWQAALVGLFYAALLASIVQWARRYDPDAIIPNFRRVMRTYQITSLGFLAFLTIQLVLRTA